MPRCRLPPHPRPVPPPLLNPPPPLLPRPPPNSSRPPSAPARGYGPVAHAWAGVPSLPAPRNHVSGFVFGPDVCVAGGRSPATTRVDCFNFENSSWVRLPDLPRATSGAGATTLDGGDAVMLGGENAQETTISDQFARLPSPDGWMSAEPMLVPRHVLDLASFQERTWACGGGSLPGLHPVSTCTSVL